MNNTLILVDAATALLTRLVEINATIAKARSEGRDVSDAEVDAYTTKDNIAKAALDAAIAAARKDPNV